MRLTKTENQQIEEVYEKILQAQAQPKEEAKEEPKQELQEVNRRPLMPDPALEKFNKRQKSPTSQWKSNPAARGIVVWLKDLKASEEISTDELLDATEGLKAIKAEGGIVIYRAEDYIVVITGN